jgi:hypothetical protein
MDPQLLAQGSGMPVLRGAERRSCGARRGAGGVGESDRVWGLSSFVRVEVVSGRVANDVTVDAVLQEEEAAAGAAWGQRFEPGKV